jgi:hypothetical protein
VAAAFSPEGMQGLGNPVAVPAAAASAPLIAVTVMPWVAVLIVGIAIVGYFVEKYLSKASESDKYYENLKEVCSKAKDEGNQALIEECRKKLLEKPVSTESDPVTTAIMVAGGVGLLFLIANFTVPKLLARVISGDDRGG